MQINVISIISPVFKTEKYLKQCIESVLKQTYTNFELIMVSDASPDNSIRIIKTFQVKDPRIKLVVNSTNMGPDRSRFEGLKAAKGEFVMYLDSDDWLPTKALQILHQKIVDEDADMVTGAVKRVIDRFGIINFRKKNNSSQTDLTKSIKMPELFDEYYFSYFGNNKLAVSVWAKLYRKSLLDKIMILPTNMKMGEDLLFNMQLHPHLQKIAFVQDNVYFYRYGGMTNTSNPTFLEDIKRQYYIKKENIEKYSYTKAIPYFKYELVNCFYSHFQNLVLLDHLKYGEVRKLVENELSDSIYADATIEAWQDEKTQMIKNKDLDGIMRIVEKQVNAQKLVHIVKSGLNKFLKLLS